MYRRRKRTQPPLIAAIEKVPVDWLHAILERSFFAVDFKRSGGGRSPPRSTPDAYEVRHRRGGSIQK